MNLRRRASASASGGGVGVGVGVVEGLPPVRVAFGFEREMSATTLTRDEATGVHVLTLRSGGAGKEPENRFEPRMVREVHERLDEVLRFGGPTCALVVTGGEGKFFSNGHDAEWLVEAARRGDGSAEAFITSFYVLLARIMTFPVPTVACINGHAFAGGLLLALACDYRVMRADKGFVCMNEIDMALVAPPPSSSSRSDGPGLRPGMFKHADRKMAAVVRARVAAPVVRDVFLRGTRLSAADAAKVGAVDAVASSAGAAAVLADAVAMAASLGSKCPPHNRRTWFVLKFELVAETVSILTDGAPHQALRPFAGVEAGHLL